MMKSMHACNNIFLFTAYVMLSNDVKGSRQDGGTMNNIYNEQYNCFLWKL